jgi:hypothetical protein
VESPPGSENLEAGPVALEERVRTWAGFLESAPPGREETAVQVFEPVGKQDDGSFRRNTAALLFPVLTLRCDSPDCAGPRFYSALPRASNPYVELFTWGWFIVWYRCNNCKTEQKVYAVAVYPADLETGTGNVRKIGEWAPFGPHVPARVISLIGPDREIFLKGRRAESQGMGIGAFAYYRRVVENQKGRLLESITSAARKLGASPETLSALERAKEERQFAKAVDDVKDAIPQALLVDGHNPLALLHSALSQGLHAESDERCLELAESIRLVLTDLAERLGQALSDDAELKRALGRLMQTKN